MATPSTLEAGVRAEESFGIQGSEPTWFKTFRIVDRYVGTIAAIVFFPISSPLFLLRIGVYVNRLIRAEAVYQRYFAHRAFRVRRGTQYVRALIDSQSGQRGPFGGHLSIASTTNTSKRRASQIHRSRIPLIGALGGLGQEFRGWSAFLCC